MSLSRAIIEGSALSIVFLFMLLLSLVANPRIWLQDYPKDIQRASPVQTTREKKQFNLIAAKMLVLALIPLAISIILDTNPITYWHTFFHFYVVFTIVSLADLIVLDWLFFCMITSNFIVVPGTKSAKGYKVYRFHFVGFLKGAVILGVWSAVLAGLRVMVAYL